MSSFTLRLRLLFRWTIVYVVTFRKKCSTDVFQSLVVVKGSITNIIWIYLSQLRRSVWCRIDK